MALRIIGASEFSIAQNGVTFSGSGPVSSTGTFADGAPYVVIGSGFATLNEPTPAQTTIGGFLVNGAMVNPVVGDHAYDGRAPDTFNAALVANTWPRVVRAGDIIVKAKSVSSLPAEDRGGVAEWATLYVLAEEPPAGSFAPAAVGWPGRGTPEPIVLTTSISDFVAGLPSYDVSAITAKPTYSEVMAVFDKWAPAMGHEYVNTSTYQALMPEGVGRDPISGEPGNYGQRSGGNIAAAALCLLRNDFTTAQKEAIATRLVSWGIQMHDPAVGAAEEYPPATGEFGYWAAGGHFQHHLAPCIAYLNLAGKTARAATFLTDNGGNFRQAIRITTAFAADQFVPHDDLLKCCTWRRRQIVSVSGNQVTFEVVPQSGFFSGDSGQFDPTSLVMTRESDGATATITSRVSSTLIGANTTFTVNINAQPSPAFASGNVITLRPPAGAALGNGDVEWAPAGISRPAFIVPSPSAVYRDLNQWSGHVMFLQAAGWMGSHLSAVKDYVVKANAANTPLSTFDMPDHFNDFIKTDGTRVGFEEAFWNAHWAAISGT